MKKIFFISKTIFLMDQHAGICFFYDFSSHYFAQ